MQSFLNIPKRPVATAVGLSALAGYLAWNVYWLCQGRIPGSILRWSTGLPSPSTGGTRSFFLLCQGQWEQSLYYNPMTIPLLGVMGVSLFQVGTQAKLTPNVARAWWVILGLAWFIKLLSPVETW